MAAKSIRRGLLVGLVTGGLAFTAVPATSASTGAMSDTDTAKTANAASTASTADASAVVAQQLLLPQQTGTLTARRGSRVIRCVVDIRTPHRAVHMRERMVTVTATVRCNHAVDSLRVRVQLFREGSVTSASRTNFDSRSISLSVTRGCVVNSTYRGRVRVRVNFPQGYHPSQSSLTVQGPAVRINRC